MPTDNAPPEDDDIPADMLDEDGNIVLDREYKDLAPDPEAADDES